MRASLGNRGCTTEWTMKILLRKWHLRRCWRRCRDVIIKMTQYVLYHNTLCVSTFGKEIICTIMWGVHLIQIKCNFSWKSPYVICVPIMLIYWAISWFIWFYLILQLPWFYFETSAKFLWCLFLFVLFPLNPSSHFNLLSVISKIHQIHL